MDSQSLWIVALSIATPVAGIVGFAIKLREVKRVHLENEKLQLEIEALKAKAAESERRIVPVSHAEVERYARGIQYSRGSAHERVEEAPQLEPKKSLKEIAITIVFSGIFIFVILLFVAYFLYDVYRFVAWIGAKL